jgi:hypothetical protein
MLLYYKPNRDGDGTETYTVNEYTGEWSPALSDHHRPKEGDIVGIHPEPDGRELDDFRMVIAELGLVIVWNDWNEEKGMDFFTVEGGAL